MSVRSLIECGICHEMVMTGDVAEWCFDQTQEGPSEYPVCERCA